MNKQLKDYIHLIVPVYKREYEWREVVGYEGFYFVSEYGDVLSIPKPGCRGKMLTPKDSHGYLRVGLSKYNHQKTTKIHRIVAKAFLSIEEGREFVNHKDGNKRNNHYSNLEWCTSKENVAHSWKMGFSKPLSRGRNGTSKLTSEEVMKLANDYAFARESQVSISNKYNISQSNVSLLIRDTLKKLLIDAGLAIDAETLTQK